MHLRGFQKCELKQSPDITETSYFYATFNTVPELFYHQTIKLTTETSQNQCELN